MTHITCRLTAKNRDQLRNPTISNRVWATLPFLSVDSGCGCVSRELDEGLEEPISSIIWATPRLQSEVQELVVVSEQLTLKYGKEFAQSCRANALQIVNEKLVHKLSVQAGDLSLSLSLCTHTELCNTRTSR